MTVFVIRAAINYCSYVSDTKNDICELPSMFSGDGWSIISEDKEQFSAVKAVERSLELLGCLAGVACNRIDSYANEVGKNNDLMHDEAENARLEVLEALESLPSISACAVSLERGEK